MYRECEERRRNIHVATFDADAAGENPYADLLIISDVHYDSKKCDRGRLDEHLQEAQRRRCFVLINGDWFDLMQGRYDPRHGKYDIRPEYKQANYIDCVINDSAEYLSKFNIPMLLGQGNHETNILKRLETNPTERLVQLLRHNGTDAYMGGYSGWFVVRLSDSIGGDRGRHYVVHYHHGSGGNAPRSKGVMKADIAQMQYPDADMIVRGHDHNKWHLPVTVKRMNGSCSDELERTVHHLQTGSYKTQGDRFAGWETEKGFNTPRMGGWFARISKHHNRESTYLKATIEEAY